MQNKTLLSWFCGVLRWAGACALVGLSAGGAVAEERIAPVDVPRDYAASYLTLESMGELGAPVELTGIPSPGRALRSTAEGRSGRLGLGGVSVTPAMVDTSIGFTADTVARGTQRELQLGSFQLTSTLSSGIRLRDERDELLIPDLGSASAAFASGLDPGAIAQDIQASSNRLLTQYPKKNSLRMNWIQYSSSEYRLDVTQHPSRTGLRYHHLATGLRVEAERRLLNSATTVFVGIRLLEDRRFDPTVGCSLNTQALETRHFCGFRLRVGL